MLGRCEENTRGDTKKRSQGQRATRVASSCAGKSVAAQLQRLSPPTDAPHHGKVGHIRGAYTCGPGLSGVRGGPCPSEARAKSLGPEGPAAYLTQKMPQTNGATRLGRKLCDAETNRSRPPADLPHRRSPCHIPFCCCFFFRHFCFKQSPFRECSRDNKALSSIPKLLPAIKLERPGQAPATSAARACFTRCRSPNLHPPTVSVQSAYSQRYSQR